MSIHQMFRRQPVPQQIAQKLQATTLPAPSRGIIMSENYSYMQPGACLICDNWAPTMRGVKLRGGHVRWAELPETTPVISMFDYASGTTRKMFAGNATKLYDTTISATPVLIKSGQTSGNYCASQMANASGDFLIAVNEAGNFPLRFDGTTWTTLNTGQITGPVGSPVEFGENLTYVWKYRNRWFFIQGNSMDAWYLGIDSIGGALTKIPLSGAASKGGKLLFGATWSIDAGDGIDDKCVMVTDQGEVLIFTGSNPGDAANWRQEGRYQLSPPMGMNAHMSIGGDLLIATVDGIIPVSQAIQKTAEQLELAAITRTIKPLWRELVETRSTMPWTMHHWDEYGGIFVATPGGSAGDRYCIIANAQTNAWGKFTGWDATCFAQIRSDMFFGTQGGIIMQADRTGYDDGEPYTATLLGGWGMFQQQASNTVWRQARASFTSGPNEPFEPQLFGCTDFILTVPTVPPPGEDPGLLEVWDQGKWDQAKWDQQGAAKPVIRNTGWVSLGVTGFTIAPGVQITVAQQVRPEVELVSLDLAFERAGVNV